MKSPVDRCYFLWLCQVTPKIEITGCDVQDREERLCGQIGNNSNIAGGCNHELLYDTSRQSVNCFPAGYQKVPKLDPSWAMMQSLQ